jgi:hypothetical protein
VTVVRSRNHFCSGNKKSREAAPASSLLPGFGAMQRSVLMSGNCVIRCWEI